MLIGLLLSLGVVAGVLGLFFLWRDSQQQSQASSVTMPAEPPATPVATPAVDKTVEIKIPEVAATPVKPPESPKIPSPKERPVFWEPEKDEPAKSPEPEKKVRRKTTKVVEEEEILDKPVRKWKNRPAKVGQKGSKK